MTESLLIVESPTKARTLSRILGKEFKIIASMGHIKDLPKQNMGVDIENGFKPEYRIIEGKKKIIQKIKKAADGVDTIYLAPDPDREGEAIAFHIAEEIKDSNKKIYRVLFNEITTKGVKEGLSSPAEFDRGKYESQKARRILDRLVGYELSPLLWRKIKRGLSAGRVQSVALRLIVEREEEIRNFVPKQYWEIFCYLSKADNSKETLRASLHRANGKRPEIKNSEEANQITKQLETSKFKVSTITKKRRTRKPPPPFITSKLQQEATRRFFMSARKVMQIAQSLYEGVVLGRRTAVGLITYMRTDSTRIAEEAVMQCRQYIKEKYGEAYLPAKPNKFPQKRSAQGAHEAIRPTSMENTPEKVKDHLTEDQFKIYKLIWDRFIQSQMKGAVYAETSVEITATPENSEQDSSANTYLLKASSSVCEFEGFQIAGKTEKSQMEGEVDMDKSGGQEPKETSETAEAEKDVSIPQSHTRLISTLKQGDELVKSSKGIIPVQKWTKPPPRYTEGTLIKELEEKSIGRPSTYATIISIILERKYVRKYKSVLYPTPLGEIVVKRLIKHFPEIMDVEFTAKMEEYLDMIEEKKIDSHEVLKKFYYPFHQNIEKAFKDMKAGISSEEINRKIEQSGIQQIPSPPQFDTQCPRCHSKLILKYGRYGFFLSCRNYPKCKVSMPPYKGVKCPAEGCEGEVVEVKMKKGRRRKFYGCSLFEKNGCKFLTWDIPVNKKCPECGSYPLYIKKEKGTVYLKCCSSSCDWKEEIPI